MKRWIVIGLVVLFFGVQVGWTEGKKNSKPQWSARMQELSQVMRELLPFLASSKAFNEKKNEKIISSQVKKLASVVKNLDSSHMSSPDSDPTLSFVGELFVDEVSRANQELKRGNRYYARLVLKEVTTYCIACHTRNNKGPDFSKIDAKVNLQKLPDSEKGDFYAATRRFSEALDAYETVIANTRVARSAQLEWENAVRKALAITVRVKRDPERSLNLVDRALKAPAAADFFKKDLTSWKQSVEAWKKEPKRSAQTQQGLLTEAKRLVSEAHKKQQFPADRGAQIEFLRASAVLHDFLASAPKGEFAAEGLYLSGVVYDALRDLGLWSLHELYYEACLKQAPKTELAKGCYTKLEESLLAGYSGSGGVSLPTEVINRLKELKKLTSP